jgi:hypothetical protein
MADQYQPGVPLDQSKSLTLSDVWQQPTPQQMMEMAMMPQKILAGRIGITNALAQAGMDTQQINKMLGSQADPGLTQGAVETEQLARQQAVTQQKQKFLEPFVKSLIETGDNELLMKLMSVYETDPHIGPMTKQLRDAGLTITGKGETEMIANLDKPKLEALAQKAATPELGDAIRTSSPGEYKIKQKGNKTIQFEPHEGKELNKGNLIKTMLFDPDPVKRDQAKQIGAKMDEHELKLARAKRAIVNVGQGNIPAMAPGASTGAVAGELNEKALVGLSEGDKNVVKMLTNYKMPLPSAFALKTPYWQGILQRASTYDPTFDASQYPTRLATRKAFTQGKQGQNITGLNTAVGHIDSLVKAYKDLDQTKVQTVNQAVNVLAKYFPITKSLEERQGKITGVKTKFNAVKGEMASIFKQSGATDQEIKSWNDTVDDPTTATPEMWKNFIASALELMGSRLGALHGQYETSMGKPADFSFLNPKSKDILKKLGVDVAVLDPTAKRETKTPGTDQEGQVPKRNPGESIAAYLKRIQK